jgi:HlyD family secretion protein
VRLSGLKDRSAVPLIGKLTRVSADAFTDEKTGMTYFTGEVVVDRDKLAVLQSAQGQTVQLRAGLPADVMVRLRPRSALTYLLEPLTDQFWGSLREQ